MNKVTLLPAVGLMFCMPVLFDGQMVLAQGYNLKKANLDKVKIEKWQCEYCPKAADATGSIGAGAAYVSDDTYRLRNSPIDGDKGGQGFVEADAAFWSKEGSRMEVKAHHLGLDDGRAEVEFKRSGDFALGAGYQRISRFDNDSGLTPFSRQGSDYLLPDNWQPAGSTADMVLDGMNAVRLKVQRDIYALQAEKTLTESGLQGFASYKRTDREGYKLTSGSILNTVSTLGKKLDDQTEQYTAGVFLPFDDGQLQFRYLRSEYTNDQDSLLWQNPFTPLYGGATEGQMAGAPKSTYQQIAIDGNYRYEQHLFQSYLSMGRIEQDQGFLPYSVNPSITTVGLPRGDLDGQVDTWAANLRWRYNVSPTLQTTSYYRFNERHNSSADLTFLPVKTDSVLSQNEVSNHRYSFRNHEVGVQGNWRVRNETRIGLGYDFDKKYRTEQARRSTDEHEIWANWRERWSDKVSSSLKLSHSERNGSSYHVDDPLLVNPLMRQYHIADRDRDQIRGDVNYQVTMALALNANLFSNIDEYEGGEVGLNKSKDHGYGLAANYQIDEDWNAYLSWQQQWLKWEQSGSNSGYAANWQGDQKDRYNTLILGSSIANLVDGKLTLGIDYTYVDSKGDTHVNLAGDQIGDSYSDIKFSNHTVSSYGIWEFDESWSSRVELLYQSLDEDDWHYDQLAIDTLPNLLATGLTPADEDAWLLGVVVQYHFN